MTANKHQSQTIIDNFGVGKNRFVRLSFAGVHQSNDFRPFALEQLATPNNVQRQIARGAHDPGRRIPGHAIKRPGLQGARQRFLHDVLGEG